MKMRPKPQLIPEFQYWEPPPPKQRIDRRHDARTELRDCWRDFLVGKTGRSNATMRYATYARDVVGDLGYKFNDGGWPSDIPFTDPNKMRGGTATYDRLLGLWKAGILRLVKATEEERRDALRDPRLVIPNAAQRAAALAGPFPQPKKLVHHITDLASRFQFPSPPNPPPSGLVLHPATMATQFTFSVLPPDASDTLAVSDASEFGKPPARRSQRSDINKSRARPVTNPEGRELRHPKRGPTTAKGVVEAAGIGTSEVGHAIESGRIVLTDEDLCGCVEVGK